MQIWKGKPNFENEKICISNKKKSKGNFWIVASGLDSERKMKDEYNIIMVYRRDVARSIRRIFVYGLMSREVYLCVKIR